MLTLADAALAVRLAPLLEAAAAERIRRNGRLIDSYFPDEGPLRRELYVKHLEFFRAGALHRERLFMAGNRVGKSDTGCYEDVLHLTGEYPAWWEGRRFACPIEAWIAGETSLTVRDILQQKLLGRWGEFGTGLIPREAIVHWTAKRGVSDSVDTVFVKARAGGTSSLGFKSYAEGRQNFQGTAKHLIHFDEEPKTDVWIESLLRTMKVPGAPAGGIAMITMTPVEGWSELIETFLGANANMREEDNP
jgi:phage terminase large subunit-like protein